VAGEVGHLDEAAGVEPRVDDLSERSRLLPAWRRLEVLSPECSSWSRSRWAVALSTRSILRRAPSGKRTQAIHRPAVSFQRTVGVDAIQTGYVGVLQAL
jgi:hypothetical protein